VIVEPQNPDFQRFRVQYQEGAQVIESQICDPTRLRSTIEPMLDRLWTETRDALIFFVEGEREPIGVVVPSQVTLGRRTTPPALCPT
jgi:hypothetical protein